MRTIKFEVNIYKYSELTSEAKSNVKQYIINTSRHNTEFTEFITDNINALGFNSVKVYYNLSYSQGDGFCFVGIIPWSKAITFDFIKKQLSIFSSEFIKSCEKNIDIIEFYKIDLRYHHTNTIEIHFYDSHWMSFDDLMKLKKIFRCWYNELCSNYENEGYKYFYEVSDEEANEYCEINNLEFTKDGNIFIEPI